MPVKIASVKTVFASVALSAALALPTAGAAQADDLEDVLREAAQAFFGTDDRRDRRGYRDRDRRGEYRGHRGAREAISIDQAIEIARANGMVRITEIELDDDEWEIEGRDYRGREMEIEIDAYTGRVKDIDYD